MLTLKEIVAKGVQKTAMEVLKLQKDSFKESLLILWTMEEDPWTKR
jgi:hypothetical protein